MKATSLQLIALFLMGAVMWTAPSWIVIPSTVLSVITIGILQFVKVVSTYDKYEDILDDDFYNHL